MSRVASRAPGLVVAAGMAVAQGCVYALNIAASRSLGSERYGGLAALLTVSILAAIPALAMQSWVARHVATDLRDAGSADDAVADVLRALEVVLVATAALAVVIALVLAHPIGAAPGQVVVATLLVVLPTVVLCAAQGRLQGGRMLGRLAVVLAVAGAARLLGGGALLFGSRAPWLVVCGVGAGTFAAAAFGWRLSALPVRRAVAADWGVLSQVLRITFATGSMWLLSNVDVVLARSLLPAHDAGVYAVGALITRAVLWAPQFVGVSTFAALTDPAITRVRLRRALAKVAALGGVAVLALGLLGPVLVPVVFGHDYDRVAGLAWLFGVLGTLLALNQLLVLQRVARADEEAALFAWLASAVAVVVVAVWLHGSVVEVLTALCVVSGALAVALFHRTTVRL